VEYTPSAFGDSEIEVSFDSKPVPGSPFTVYINSSIDASQTEISGLDHIVEEEPAEITISVKDRNGNPAVGKSKALKASLINSAGISLYLQ
jgi:hypothetical protein